MGTEPTLESASERRGAFVAGLTNLYCHDVEAALRFYTGQLGFAETFRTPKMGVPEHVEVALRNGFKLGLSSVEAAKRLHGVNTSPGSPAMAITVWTDDTDRAFDRLIEAGVPVVQPPHDTVNNNRAALLRDPDGNLVEIVAKVPSKTAAV
jgi:catechol 2,3-dioxygenase-like lactoylglutathione lyase family enzyme